MIVEERSTVVEVDDNGENILVTGDGPPGPPGEVGPPGPAGPYSPAFEQRFASPLDTWLIAHRLGARPSVTLLDESGSEFEADIATQ